MPGHCTGFHYLISIDTNKDLINLSRSSFVNIALLVTGCFACSNFWIPSSCANGSCLFHLIKPLKLGKWIIKFQVLLTRQTVFLSFFFFSWLDFLSGILFCFLSSLGVVFFVFFFAFQELEFSIFCSSCCCVSVPRSLSPCTPPGTSVTVLSSPAENATSAFGCSPVLPHAFVPGCLWLTLGFQLWNLSHS